jgi:hypothetical protein
MPYVPWITAWACSSCAPHEYLTPPPDERTRCIICTQSAKAILNNRPLGTTMSIIYIVQSDGTLGHPRV